MRRPDNVPESTYLMARDEVVDLLAPLAERLGLDAASLRYLEVTRSQIIAWPSGGIPVVVALTKPSTEPLGPLADWDGRSPPPGMPE